MAFINENINLVPILVVIALVLAGCSAAPGSQARENIETVMNTMSEPEQTQRVVEKGTWGGDGIMVNVDKAVTTIEFSCADARIDGELKTDRSGKFSVIGVYIAQTPGPMRVDRPPAEQRARFEGRITGKRLNLKITLVEGKTDLGEFNVEHGKMARVFRCY